MFRVRARYVAAGSFALAAALGAVWGITEFRLIDVDITREDSVWIGQGSLSVRHADINELVARAIADSMATGDGITPSFGLLDDEPSRWHPVWTYNASWDWTLHLPLCIPITAFSLVGGAALRVDRRVRRRAGANACVGCGYSLAGLAPGSACPECGAANEPRA